jgi:hypothetical protein
MKYFAPFSADVNWKGRGEYDVPCRTAVSAHHGMIICLSVGCASANEQKTFDIASSIVELCADVFAYLPRAIAHRSTKVFDAGHTSLDSF